MDPLVRTIDFLIAVDSPLTQYFNYDESKIRSAVVTLMHSVSAYLYPLKIRVALAEIVPIKGYNLSLDDFGSWKKAQNHQAAHDIAVLLRYKHEGGIAYVNGVCSVNSIAVAGFTPEATSKNAWLFIHEVAHVLGLSHEAQATCSCVQKQPGECLRLKGFEECSAQQLADLLPKHRCLEPNNRLRRPIVSLCGNGIKEFEEECDCGPEKWCDNILCNATDCRFVLKKNLLFFIFSFGSAFIFFIVLVSTGEFTFNRVKKLLHAKGRKVPPSSPVCNEVEEKRGRRIGNKVLDVAKSPDLNGSYVVMNPPKNLLNSLAIFPRDNLLLTP
ncbi:unnamed protein product [Caenorhabditis auriculariae]|uniref:Peptidase M12B domain-containing protein n=1 Tax=Caenorhabditis auriculariae TaxID=2777116 RepID=A0A8S1H183_9PELO|nr:unnamed protein product [Caenorhabditis auriculariae]